ncbi:MAG: MMPL family transporter [Crocinitomicaceae bacterium]|nr:MMPL family transporter [Crocinitomicaceae bacterium]
MILSLLLGVSVVFGYFAATNIKIDNTYGTMLPKDSQPKKDYQLLKTRFGGNESLLIFCIQNDELYTVEKFAAWYELGERVAEFDAVDSVMSEAHIYELHKDSVAENFYFEKVLKKKPETQEEVDRVKEIVRNHPVYNGFIFNKETHTSLMLLFVSEHIMKDIQTANVLFEVENVAKEYEDILGEVRISGMPHIRVAVGAKLKGELGLFIALSIFMTSLLLFVFFRSIKIVIICNIVVLFGVIWSLGSIGAFDFQLSILMVLIPPLIIVISIPNCIFLINKFHQEIISHGNKAKALSRVIQKIGNATFLTNLTTALGFSTFIFTNSERLSEFGIIASINILAVFVLSITILPIVLSYSAIPKPKHLKHLEKQWLHLAVEKLEFLSLYRRKAVFAATGILVIVATIGLIQTKATGNITGDLPKDDPITTDLRFIEKNFGGSIPFDIILDTKKPGSFYKRFQEIEEVQQYLAGFDEFSKSISLADGIKLVNMAYHNGDRDKFEIPSTMQLKEINEYLENTNVETNNTALLDSTQTLTRISLQIKDTGSYEIQGIVDSIHPIIHKIVNPDHEFLVEKLQVVKSSNGDEKATAIQEIYDRVPAMEVGLTKMYDVFDSEELATKENEVGFNDSLQKLINQHEWGVIITGTSVVASNGTQYLVTNLFISLGIAIVVIGCLMALLFGSWRMVVASLVPNFIPLLFTAGIMGYTGIPIKPSTLLVFSIAFGISVDDTIHFLAKFRQEMKGYRHDLRRCILVALRETGISMIYTSIVLFFGFLMFTFSQFGGTKALGLLVSLTLLIAMFANLMILPSLLLGMEKKITDRAMREPLLQLYNEEEDIELDHLEIEQTLERYKEEDTKKSNGQTGEGENSPEETLTNEGGINKKSNDKPE